MPSKDYYDTKIKSATIKNLQTEETFDPFWGMDKNDVLSFTKKMDETTNELFKNIDRSKINNLYDYIFEYFSKVIDTFNNKCESRVEKIVNKHLKL